MKLFRMGGLLFGVILLLSLLGCGETSEVKKEMEKALSITLPEQMEVVTSIDTHGGFHGDGDTYYIVQISLDARDSFGTQLAEKAWSPLPSGPVSEWMNVISYAKEEVFPESFGNGYYVYLDRSPDGSDAPAGLPLNFTLGIYDKENGNLYYWKFDS